MKYKKYKNTQRNALGNTLGNALFLILIAVALFAALSYAVTSSGRGGGGIDREQAEIAAAEVTQFFGGLQSHIQRLQIIGGCSVENLDWRHDTWLTSGGSFFQSGGGTPNPPVSPKAGCEVFPKYGGSFAPQTFENHSAPGLSKSYGGAAGHVGISWIKKAGVGEGTNRPDIGVIIHGLRQEVCARILDTTPAQLSAENLTGGDTCTLNCAEPSTIGHSYTIQSPVNQKSPYFASTKKTKSADPAYCDMGYVLISR